MLNISTSRFFDNLERAYELKDLLFYHHPCLNKFDAEHSEEPPAWIHCINVAVSKSKVATTAKLHSVTVPWQRWRLEGL
jgi:hypothetical protein